MSKFAANEPACTKYGDAISVLVSGRSKDLGGFCVRRVLPASMARSVGPFVFFDEMGPADFPAGQGINVRPHPHIGLATVTYLFEGEILHHERDRHGPGVDGREAKYEQCRHIAERKCIQCLVAAPFV